MRICTCVRCLLLFVFLLFCKTTNAEGIRNAMPMQNVCTGSVAAKRDSLAMASDAATVRLSNPCCLLSFDISLSLKHFKEEHLVKIPEFTKS